MRDDVDIPLGKRQQHGFGPRQFGHDVIAPQPVHQQCRHHHGRKHPGQIAQANPGVAQTGKANAAHHHDHQDGVGLFDVDQHHHDQAELPGQRACPAGIVPGQGFQHEPSEHGAQAHGHGAAGVGIGGQRHLLGKGRIKDRAGQNGGGTQAPSTTFVLVAARAEEHKSDNHQAEGQQQKGIEDAAGVLDVAAGQAVGQVAEQGPIVGIGGKGPTGGRHLGPGKTMGFRQEAGGRDPVRELVPFRDPLGRGQQQKRSREQNQFDDAGREQAPLAAVEDDASHRRPDEYDPSKGLERRDECHAQSREDQAHGGPSVERVPLPQALPTADQSAKRRQGRPNAKRRHQGDDLSAVGEEIVEVMAHGRDILFSPLVDRI